MKLKPLIYAIPLLLLAGASAFYYLHYTKKENELQKVKVASWNLEIFGEKKAKDVELMKEYRDILKGFDIIFLQEIKDISGKSFQKLSDMFPEYYSTSSISAGRNPPFEKYGLLVRKDSKIKIKSFKDYSPDSLDRWERPPIEVTFSINSSNSIYDFTIYSIHTKPSDVKNELSNLEKITTNSGNVIVMGDLNASPPYYNAKKEKDFDFWHWVIKDTDDTTITATHAAFDRIILNVDASKELESGGIYTNLVQRRHSNHYPVSFEIVPRDR